MHRVSVLQCERLYLLEEPRAGHVPSFITMRRADERALGLLDNSCVLRRPLDPQPINDVDRVGVRHPCRGKRQVLRPEDDPQIPRYMGSPHETDKIVRYWCIR